MDIQNLADAITKAQVSAALRGLAVVFALRRTPLEELARGKATFFSALREALGTEAEQIIPRVCEMIAEGRQHEAAELLKSRAFQRGMEVGNSWIAAQQVLAEARDAG